MTGTEEKLFKITESIAESAAGLAYLGKVRDEDRELLRDVERRLATLEQSYKRLEGESAERTRRSSELLTIWVPLIAALVGAVVGSLMTSFLSHGSR